MTTTEVNGQKVTKLSKAQKKKAKERADESKAKKKSKKAEEAAAAEGAEEGEEEEAASTAMEERPTLTEAEKKQLREEAKKASEQIEESYFHLADTLYQVYDSAAYLDWEGTIALEEGGSEDRKYKDFEEYCENEIGMSVRTGHYFVRIARWFSEELREFPEVKEKVKQLGWSKVKELDQIVTADNVDEWVEKAKSMTVSQLAAEAKRFLNGGKTGKGDKAEKVARKSFTLIDDQLSVVEKALESAKATANTEKDGFALTLVCTDYLANEVRPKEGSQTMAYLKRMEKILSDQGIKLIAVDVESQKVVYGKQAFAALTKE